MTLTLDMILTSSENSGVKHETFSTQLHSQLKTSTSPPNLALAAKGSFQPPSEKNAIPVAKRALVGSENVVLRTSIARPHFKVEQGPGNILVPVGVPPDYQGGFPGRPRSASGTLTADWGRHALTKLRSAADLGKPSTSGSSYSGFKPALETLTDEPTLAGSVAEQVPSAIYCPAVAQTVWFS
ncbi:hypothetical protein PAXINDRAFT_16606 [Paxillus involutus ATCC 200175]|uniref:Uncharacterized protein n=1 Tax=Paxillus involutus ATCC 200175 TaxID=664439 RepID=A0A0C9SRE1_PAXIN|nr:hypothetical protein PAXINDRAFT_16606 [Paxillus involutus ATCC 200175]